MLLWTIIVTILKRWGKFFRGTNGEHHEALHHSLKTMERDRNLYMKRNHGSPVHQQKSHQSISVRNALNAGFTPKEKLRIRKSKTHSESSNSPKTSPRKGVFNHSKSFVNIFNRPGVAGAVLQTPPSLID